MLYEGLAENEWQPVERPSFDPRFVTGNFVPKIIEHNGRSVRVHETNSLPLLLNAGFLLDMGTGAKSASDSYSGNSYAELIQNDPVMQESLHALQKIEDLSEVAAYAVYLHFQEADESSGWQRIRTLEEPEVVAHLGIDPASPELVAKKEYDLSCVYVFLADTARRIDPAYDIDNFRR